MSEVTPHKRTTKLTESTKHLEGNSYALKNRQEGDSNTGQYAMDNQNQTKQFMKHLLRFPHGNCSFHT